MTKLEFSGPGLSNDQWERINGLAVSLKPGQGLWLSGYFAGLDYNARALGGFDDLALLTRAREDAPPIVAATTRTLTILFGTETGNSKGLAKALAEAAQQQGIVSVVADMSDYKTRKLKEEQDLLVITSTHGEGDPPQSAVAFFEFLEGRKAPKLPDVRFAVLALGDSTYERYCEGGKRIDRRLEELGATRLEARVDCDVDYEDAAAAWIAAVVARLAPKAAQQSSASRGVEIAGQGATLAPSTPAFDKQHPFTATIIENLVLTGRGSSKETRHIELSLEGSGLTYEPGDALGIVPHNDPVLVEQLLEGLSLPADASVTARKQTLPLHEALSSAFEITSATPRFIDHWAELSGAAELQQLRGAEQAEARAAFMRDNHVIDIVRRFPVKGLHAESFVKGLRPLQPRLYSISSSLAAASDEAHLTVSTVRYELNGQQRAGVTSSHLATRAEVDATLPVYIQANTHFRLPHDDAPIIMIGAGTGVAPYRAFVQEREARGAKGKSWLVFGERNFRSDFLYQVEWQSYLKDGVLSRMDVAFSRDRTPKAYVQDRLRQSGRDVYAWLEEGAHIYVCGDAARLAPDVHAALTDIVAEQGGLDVVAAGEYLANLQRNHRYQRDVY
ncbi:MAG: sulfite reductase [NADPH] flavoprotein, alpha-component [Rhizobiales bacterium 62-47]|nr:assimilatory sulfite reductase (NADPH) flavoprotein subunit [Hyphomicrobiales bacterium]OJY11443.1 MAG: sulfite reductase [NADPH] flavoprotein, alpha-component [Rhizobiales bacterium 62-47]